MATTPYPFVASTVLTALQLNSTFNIPTTTKTASHTLVAADAGTRVFMNSASSTTITVNISIFAASDVVEIVNIGSGTCTVTAGTATVSSAGPLAIPQNGGGRLVFSSASAATYFPTAVTQSASGVVQVKSTTKTDTFTTTSTSFTDITGLSVSITPTSASNKILVMATVTGSQDVGINQMFLQLVRDSTAIGIGDAASSRTRATLGFTAQSEFIQNAVAMNFLDSPATTSATTYKVQTKVISNTGFINRSDSDGDSADRIRTISTITVMEVAP